MSMYMVYFVSSSVPFSVILWEELHLNNCVFSPKIRSPLSIKLITSTTTIQIHVWNNCCKKIFFTKCILFTKFADRCNWLCHCNIFSYQDIQLNYKPEFKLKHTMYLIYKLIGRPCTVQATRILCFPRPITV